MKLTQFLSDNFIKKEEEERSCFKNLWNLVEFIKKQINRLNFTILDDIENTHNYSKEKLLAASDR